MLRRERLSTHTQRVRQDVSDFYSNETGRFLKPGRALILHTRGFLKPGRALIPHARGFLKPERGLIPHTKDGAEAYLLRFILAFPG